MDKCNHTFNVGDKVNFTDVSYRISIKRRSVQYKTVHGSIVSIDEKNRALIKINRSKNTRLVHVCELSLEGKPSALTQAFIDAVRKDFVDAGSEGA